MYTILCDQENAKVIVADNNFVITTVLSTTRDLSDTYDVINSILGENTIGITAEDIRAMNDEKTVRVASAIATGENCVTEVFQKAFLNMKVSNVCIVLKLDKNVPLDTVIEGDNILDDENVFDKDGTVIWCLEETDQCGKNAYLTAVIFS